jgi:cobalt/nickel transport system permease protein
MHIPDGFLDAKTALTAAAISATGLAIAMPRLRRQMPPRKVPLLGLTAAFVFAAQMLNFPVGGGTSGHLVGAILVVALLGPAAAVVVLTAVLVVQCFLFADGGVTALGANILNLGLIASVGGATAYRGIRRVIPGRRGMVVGSAFAGWISMVLAAIACAGQLAFSGQAPWQVAFPAMTAVHMVIGLGEGLITALILIALARVRPDLLAEDPAAEPGGEMKTLAALGLVATLGLVMFVAPFADPSPDGLERVAALLGMDTASTSPAPFSAPFPDYSGRGFASPIFATAAAGALGTVIVFALSWVLGRLLVPTATVDRT